MPGTPPPPLAGGDPATLDPAAPRLRLKETEAHLSQTQTELATARLTIAEHDAAQAAAAAAAAALHDGAGTAGGRRTGGAALGGADGVTSAPPAIGITGGAGGSIPTPTDGGTTDRPYVLPAPANGGGQDYDRVGDGESSDSPADWLARTTSVRAGRGATPRHYPYADEAAVYNDGFDTIKVSAADEWLHAFGVPRSILRGDGMPVPFAPDDNVHSATFPNGGRDELEARRWYCTLAWVQHAHNEALDGHHAVDSTPDDDKQLIEFLLCALNRTYAIGVSRYDYLALRQSEPAMAEAFAHSDAVPRNPLRGDGARRYLSRVVRQETLASAKIGAAERGFSYSSRTAGRVSGRTAPASGGASRAGGGGGGSSGDGRGGGAPGHGKDARRGGAGGSGGGSSRGRGVGRGGRGGGRA